MESTLNFIDPIIEDVPGMSEIQIQTKAVTWIHNNIPQSRKMVFHVPNGEQRNAITGMQLKASGVVAGVPDILMIAPDCVCHGVEVKAPGGYPSATQKNLHEVWMKNNVPLVILYTSQDIINYAIKLYCI